MSVYMILETTEAATQHCSTKNVLLKFFAKSTVKYLWWSLFFHLRWSANKVVHKNFVKLTRNHLCQSLFLNKDVGASHFQNTFLTVHLEDYFCFVFFNWLWEEKKKGSSTVIFSWVLLQWIVTRNSYEKFNLYLVQ